MFSDLAVDFCREKSDNCGVTVSETRYGAITERLVEITTPEAERMLGKPCGKYFSLEVPQGAFPQTAITLRLKDAIGEMVAKRLPKGASVLIVGFGNGNLACDALGTLTLERVIAGQGKRTHVLTLAPGVEGVTGIAGARVVHAVIKEITPQAVLCIDALVGAEFYRVGNVFQLTDTGLAPGSGTGNRTQTVSRETLGVPVFALGVPLAISYAGGQEGIDKKCVVCPREIDVLVRRVSRVLAEAINLAFYPELSLADIRGAVF